MHRRSRDLILSAVCLIVVLAGLIAIDPRVRDRFTAALGTATHTGASEWVAQADAIGSAVVQAARHQSVDQAPLVIFTVVAGLLVIFMLRT